MGKIPKKARSKHGLGLLAEYQRALSLRQFVRDYGITAEAAPEVVSEAEQKLGQIEVRNLVDGESAQLVMDGPVWPSEWAFPGEISPANVRQALEDVGDVDALYIYLNSPGGDPFAGHAIHGMLGRYAGKVHIHIEGLAASAASIIAVGADNLVVYPNSTLMIHSALVVMIGWFNAGDLRKEAEVLDQVDQALVAAYRMKTGRDEEVLRDMVHAETWLVGREIVDEGFADELVGGDDAPTAQASVLSAKDAEASLVELGVPIPKVTPLSPAAGIDNPDPPEEPDGEDEKLKLLALELELLSAAPF